MERQQALIVVLVLCSVFPRAAAQSSDVIRTNRAIGTSASLVLLINPASVVDSDEIAEAAKLIHLLSVALREISMRAVVDVVMDEKRPSMQVIDADQSDAQKLLFTQKLEDVVKNGRVKNWTMIKALRTIQAQPQLTSRHIVVLWPHCKDRDRPETGEFERELRRAEGADFKVYVATTRETCSVSSNDSIVDDSAFWTSLTVYTPNAHETMVERLKQDMKSSPECVMEKVCFFKTYLLDKCGGHYVCKRPAGSNVNSSKALCTMDDCKRTCEKKWLTRPRPCEKACTNRKRKDRNYCRYCQRCLASIQATSQPTTEAISRPSGVYPAGGNLPEIESTTTASSKKTTDLWLLVSVGVVVLIVIIGLSAFLVVYFRRRRSRRAGEREQQKTESGKRSEAEREIGKKGTERGKARKKEDRVPKRRTGLPTIKKNRRPMARSRAKIKAPAQIVPSQPKSPATRRYLALDAKSISADGIQKPVFPSILKVPIKRSIDPNTSDYYERVSAQFEKKQSRN